MSQKKIFLALVAISTVSLLVHHGGHLSRTLKAFRLGCLYMPSLSSSADGNLPAKHTSVVFLKTHKTASSTVQNLLFRFAEHNNLTVAMPITACDHQFCYPRLFSSHYVHPHTLPADIITSHMRFSHAELSRVMPNDSIYITILREPGAMFESLFTYYNQHCLSFKRVPNGSLDLFLDQPWAYYRSKEKDSMFARNTLTFDLGGDKDWLTEEAAMYAKRFAQEMERVFSLVMISEHFDESLVLLRRLLSWDMEDVLYVKLNMRMASSKSKLSDDQRAKIRAWNAIDAALYDHFNASLWRQLREIGLACVEREVQAMRHARDHLMHRCFGGSMPLERSSKQISNKELRPWQPSSKVAIVGYDLPTNISKTDSVSSQDLCLKLIMPELPYSRLLLRAQSLRYRSRFPPQTTQNTVKPPVKHRRLSGTISTTRPASMTKKSTKRALRFSQRPTSDN